MAVVERKVVQNSHGVYEVDRHKDGKREQVTDLVAEEVPVAMVYNGLSHAVMMATPQDLEDFGIGFSLSEGILRGTEELYDIQVVPQAEGIEVRMAIAVERFGLLKQWRRNLTGRSGCGLCGVESLQHAVRHPGPVRSEVRVSGAGLTQAFTSLSALQRLNSVTGAVHAAGWALSDGTVRRVREDVGRHNALDKLIGRLACEGADLEQGVALITSRASYEMVQKAATVGIPVLAAVSAPTGLAVRLAKESGVTLMAFVRHQNYVIYAHPQRVLALQGAC